MMTPLTVKAANPIDERPIESVGHPWDCNRLGR
jgi:hypothetical protein